ncbi:MAG: hypothetical protein JWN43_3206, partial [Gammaproteobacteria bacterium]|nr:hypothetical protein [Gammaproteobacteria bacterium]
LSRFCIGAPPFDRAVLDSGFSRAWDFSAAEASWNPRSLPNPEMLDASSSKGFSFRSYRSRPVFDPKWQWSIDRFA